MEDLSKYTKIELQKMGNDIKDKHEALKKEIVAETYEIEKLEGSINRKAEELQELEKNYVEIVEKLVE